MDAPFSLPTPPTLEQRLDAAGKEYHRLGYGLIEPDPAWESLPEKTRATYRRHMRIVCRAFAPEHFKDTDNG